MLYKCDKVPLIQQDNITLPLYVPLTESLEVPRECRLFSSLTDENRQRVLMNLPLPNINRGRFLLKATSSNVSSSSNSDIKVGFYNINNKQYRIPQQHFKSANPFSTTIHKGNVGDMEEFDEKYVKGFISKYESSYLDWDQIALNGLNQRMNTDALGNKRSLEKLLDENLYKVIKSPVRHSLEIHKDTLKEEIDYFVEKKGGTVKLTQEASPRITEPPLTTIFANNGEYSTQFMGLHCFPDVFLGLGGASGGHTLEAILGTLIGETKLGSLYLRGYLDIVTEKTAGLDEIDLEEIQKIKGGSAAKFKRTYKDETDARQGFAETNSKRMDKVEEVIRKLITTACHVGVNRVMVTSYSDILLIRLDPKFIVLGSPHFKRDSAFDDIPALYLKSTHYHIKSSDALARLKVLSFFETNKTSLQELKLFQKNVGDHLAEKNRIFFEEKKMFQKPPTPSKTPPSSGDSLRKHLDNLRISIKRKPDAKKQSPDTKKSKKSKESEDALSELDATSKKGNCNSLLDSDCLFKEEKLSNDKSPTLASSMFKDFSIKGIRNKKENEPLDNHNASEKTEFGNLQLEKLPKEQGAQDSAELFILDEDVFLTPLIIELGKMTGKFLQCGWHKSQVLVVNKNDFLVRVPSENVFGKPLENENEILIKIYDPLWANRRTLNAKDLTVAYQNSVNMCLKEISVYSTLSSLTGIAIPKFIGGITLDDCTVSVGKKYIRTFGPAIILQNLENERHPNFGKKDVTREFIQGEIMAQIDKIHALGVVHGDFKFENMLVTKQKKVIILDFSHSHTNATREEIQEEVEMIYSYFGFTF